MNADATQAYYARFARVLEQLEARAEELPDIDELAAVAAFSRCHFQRQFSALFGVGAARLLQLIRLKRASHRLAFREQASVLEIAQASGYEGGEAFARAFKRLTGQSPSEFRARPDWSALDAGLQPLSTVRSQHMSPRYTDDEVRVIDVAPVRVALYPHRGDPARLGDSVRRFIAWRRREGLPPKISATYNLWHDDPEQTPPDQFRFDFAAATDREIAANDEGVTAGVIPGGRCAVLRHVGGEDTLPDAVRHLYARWLPRSGEETRDFPLYFQRVAFFPDVPEHEAVTDIFLPLA